MFGLRDGEERYQPYCKPCMNAYSRQWKEDNKLKVLAQSKKYREKNKDKIKEKRDEMKAINNFARLIVMISIK